MPATPDRTTIKAALEALTEQLRDSLVADPPTATQPFRRVEIGALGVEEFPRPFLSLLIAGTRTIGVVDNDKIIEVTIMLRVVVDAIAADPHAALLDPVGAVDDYFDSVMDTGVVEGAEGFDDQAWKIEYPRVTAGSRVAVASAAQRFVVRVERGQNREPAA